MQRNEHVLIPGQITFLSWKDLSLLLLRNDKMTSQRGYLKKSHSLSVEDPNSKPGSLDIQFGAMSIVLH